MKLIKKILLALLVLFIIAQFFGPDKNEGDYASIESFLNETKPSTEVKGILKESCFDCHSSVTRYPWYNNITPVNYWLADHIKHGKGHFDVSKWDEYSVKKKDHKLDELIEMVEDKVMPLDSYTWTHSEAKLTDAQIKAVNDWAKGVRATYAAELSND
ncbi:heme-binding domain-containing protein [Psychroserpens ponticola]|uniref:Heme-binding domain-containing protein n=1 Tax=Psychroserpens ponticola TaxID=2932268 RepID=A0ABY7RTA4_9FLAO|nr:heme-binding domain-containing protein [Psychroserpens ponticola]WCO00337.1 heme-binding domain-containing protein [Psychroserpens ponticola]